MREFLGMFLVRTTGGSPLGYFYQRASAELYASSLVVVYGQLEVEEADVEVVSGPVARQGARAVEALTFLKASLQEAGQDSDPDRRDHEANREGMDLHTGRHGGMDGPLD